MTNEKLQSVFSAYGICLRANGINAHEMPEELKTKPAAEVAAEVRLEHVAYMCETALDFVSEGRIEKAMRWLGFVQGTLYELGLYTIDDLKEHSRPESEMCDGAGKIYDHIRGTMLNEVDIWDCPGCPACQPVKWGGE